MTPLRKLSLLIMFGILISIVSVVMGYYILLGILLVIVCFLCNKWFYLLTEELIVYHLLKGKRQCNINYITNIFGEKAIKTIAHLEEKKIIEVNDKDVLLKISSYNFSIKRRRHR